MNLVVKLFSLVFAAVATTATLLVGLLLTVVHFVVVLPFAAYGAAKTGRTDLVRVPRFNLRRKLWQLFPPPEIQQTARELEVLADSDSLRTGKEMTAYVLERAKPLVGIDWVVYSIRIGNHTPRSAALTLVAQVAREAITSGRFHLTIGMLNEQGHELYDCWSHANQELLRLECISPDRWTEEQDEVEDEIDETDRHYSVR